MGGAVDAPGHGMEQKQTGDGPDQGGTGPRSKADLKNVPIVASGHHGMACWDDALQTYSAWLDVFGWGRPGYSGRFASPACSGGTRPWLRNPDCQSMPTLVVGDQHAQHLTVDSLRLDLNRKGLSLDADSWNRLLDLRQVVARCFGDVLIEVTGATSVNAQPPDGIQSRSRGALGQFRLDVILPDGNHFYVPPRLISTVSNRTFSGLNLTMTEAAGRIVDLVWSRFADGYDSIVLEVAYEVLDRDRPVSLLAASLADWIAHGSGPAKNAPGDRNNVGVVRTAPFRQLSLEL